MFTNKHAKLESYVIRIKKAIKNPYIFRFIQWFKIWDCEKIKRNSEQIYVKMHRGFMAL
jgi:hypothetical protein